jgi:phosphoglycerol transferase MdoB-like AlkP superfamily enzyme
MARKNDFNEYVKAKYYLQVLITMITFLPLAVVIAVSGRMNMFLLTALMLFNLGPNSFIVMMLSLFNDGRVDLGAGTFLNYQGMKGSQFVMTFLFVLIPVLAYSLILKIANETTAIIILASLGIIFIAFSNWWLEKYIASAFLRRKYKSLEGYRKLSA